MKNFDMTLVNATETQNTENTELTAKKENFTVTSTEFGNKVKANWTLENMDKACEIIANTADKTDYAKAVMAYVYIENVRLACLENKKSDKETKKLVKAMKDELVTMLRFKDTAVIDKYYKVADNFIEVSDDLLTAHVEHNIKNGTEYTLDVNFKAVHAKTDKFGFEFSLTALQEMCWLTDSNGEIDMQKIDELIADGKLKASMPACNDKIGIRAIVKENKYKAIDTTADVTQNTTDGTQNATDVSQDAKEKETVQFTKTSDKERVTAIQSIINGITDTQFTTNKMVTDFIEYIGEYLKNSK